MLAATARAPRVLIVDDEFDIAETMAELLGAEGYAVALAHDGLHAFEQIPKFEPDLILLDLMMPRMNGFEVLERLREARNPTPVVVVSANQGYEAADLNVAGKVRKPCSFERLLDAVKAALARAPLRGAEAR
ncbi:MAG: response regulator transcription factor [Myxococcales bacterium]